MPRTGRCRRRPRRRRGAQRACAVASRLRVRRAAGRAARRRHRGPGGRVAGPRARARRGRARPTSPGCSPQAHRGRALRRRGQPAARPPRRPAAGRRRDGPRARRAGRRVGRARRAVPAGRHDEPGGGRAAAAAARPVRAHRRGRGVARRRHRASRWCAGGWRSRRTRRRSPPTFAEADERRAGAPDRGRAGPAGRRWCCPTPSCAGSPRSAPSFDVDGMRADLVIARAATAHAAWRGADAVAKEDVRAAARLALPHRRRRNPFDEPGLDEQAARRRPGRRRRAEPDPDPDGPDPRRSAGGGAPDGRRRRTTAADGPDAGVGQSTHPAPRRTAPERRAPRPTAAARQRRARRRRPAVPRPAARGPRRRRGRARPPVAGPHRARPDRPAPPPAPRGAPPSCTCPPPSRPPPRTSGPAAGPAPGSSSRRADLRRAVRRGARGQPRAVRRRRVAGRWPPGAGWPRSRARCCRCCSTPTSAATRSGWSPSAATGAEVVLPPTSSVDAAPARLADAAAPAAARRWPTGLLRARRRAAPSSGCATPAGAPLLVVRHRRPGHVAARPADPVRDACRAAGLLAADGDRHGRRRLRDRAGAARPGRAARRAPRARRWSPLGELSADARRRRRPRGAAAAVEEEPPMPQGQRQPSPTTASPPGSAATGRC